jgi:copper chaperone NosL
VAPGEDPIFFDDIGCLADYLRQHSAQPARATIYVADHRTSEWAAATAAVFTRVAGLDTPMASHLIAHASPSSRDADPAARGGIDVPPAALFPAMSQAGIR